MTAVKECLPPEKLRIGFSSMLKATVENKSGYFDRTKREHVEFACNMYLDSLQNSMAGLVNDEDRGGVTTKLVDWAIANPNAPTFSECGDDNNHHSKKFFPFHLKMKSPKSKRKPTKIGAVIQHVNKPAKVPPSMNTTSGGDVEIMKAASLSLQNSTVSSVTDYTYSTSNTIDGNPTASLSFDTKGSKSIEEPLRKDGMQQYAHRNLSVIPESGLSLDCSGAIVSENGVEISPTSAARRMDQENIALGPWAEDPYMIATPRVRN